MKTINVITLKINQAPMIQNSKAFIKDANNIRPTPMNSKARLKFKRTWKRHVMGGSKWIESAEGSIQYINTSDLSGDNHSQYTVNKQICDHKNTRLVEVDDNYYPHLRDVYCNDCQTVIKYNQPIDN